MPRQPPLSRDILKNQDFIIEKCTVYETAKNIRPDLGSIDREIKQTISFYHDGTLICNKSLTYTPKNEHFSNVAWNERVLLKDLNPNQVSVNKSDNVWI